MLKTTKKALTGLKIKKKALRGLKKQKDPPRNEKAPIVLVSLFLLFFFIGVCGMFFFVYFWVCVSSWWCCGVVLYYYSVCMCMCMCMYGVYGLRDMWIIIQIKCLIWCFFKGKNMIMYFPINSCCDEQRLSMCLYGQLGGLWVL